jgi:predicted ATPase
MTVQPLEVIESFGVAQNVGFLKGNVVKYLLRAGHKDEMMQDLLKAQDYLNRLVEFVGSLPKTDNPNLGPKR